MARSVEISTLSPGDLCFMDDGKIAKVVGHIHQHIPRQEKTKFEDEYGHIDWVWSKYIVIVD